MPGVWGRFSLCHVFRRREFMGSNAGGWGRFCALCTYSGAESSWGAMPGVWGRFALSRIRRREMGVCARMRNFLAGVITRAGGVDLSTDTDREKRASFDRQASATDSVSFLGLFQPKTNKTVFFFVSFHQGVTQSGILFLVSIERGTSPRVYHHRPWLSDMSQLGGALCRFLAPLAVARVSVSDRRAEEEGKVPRWAVQLQRKALVGDDPNAEDMDVRPDNLLSAPITLPKCCSRRS